MLEAEYLFCKMFLGRVPLEPPSIKFFVWLVIKKHTKNLPTARAIFLLNKLMKRNLKINKIYVDITSINPIVGST